MKQLNRQFNGMNSTVGWHVKHNTFKTTKLGPPVLSAIVTMQCFVFTQDVCNHVNSSLHISDTQVLARIHPVSKCCPEAVRYIWIWTSSCSCTADKPNSWVTLLNIYSETFAHLQSSDRK